MCLTQKTTHEAMNQELASIFCDRMLHHIRTTHTDIMKWRDDDGNPLFPITEEILRIIPGFDVIDGKLSINREAFECIVGVTPVAFTQQMLDNSIGISEAVAKTPLANLDHILHKSLRALRVMAKGNYYELQRMINGCSNMQLMFAGNNQHDKSSELTVDREWIDGKWIDVSVSLIFTTHLIFIHYI